MDIKKRNTKKSHSEDVAQTTNVQPIVFNDQPADQTDQPENLHTIQPPVVADQPSESEATVPADTSRGTVAAQTHAAKRNKKSTKFHFAVGKRKRLWLKVSLMTTGAIALILVVTGLLATLPYNKKTLPNVYIAGIDSGGKDTQQLKAQLQERQNNLKVTLRPDGKTLQPKLSEIGFKVDVDKTVQNALNAKRKNSSIVAKFLFWQKQQVPAVVTVDNQLLTSYVEAHAPELIKAPQDAQLQFDATQAQFVVTKQGDGQGPNIESIRQGLLHIGQTLSSQTVSVGVTKVTPTMTESKLEALVPQANEYITRKVVLSGGGFNFTAKQADIATWLVPTPQSDGSIKLVIDPGKVQTYVQLIGQKISSAPQDEKVITDPTSGASNVLVQGKNGTELKDVDGLVAAITKGVSADTDVVQPMDVEVAAYKTVNMNSYDKWIEVDLSQQSLIAYEKSKPVMNVLIASGVNKYPTVTGEFSIYLKVRSQTMTGGSKADGSYYNLPNVEWVNYFYQDYAIHGAYWRKVFGVPGSHGCVNMTNADAQFIYNWAPLGTKVIVHA